MKLIVDWRIIFGTWNFSCHNFFSAIFLFILFIMSCVRLYSNIVHNFRLVLCLHFSKTNFFCSLWIIFKRRLPRNATQSSCDGYRLMKTLNVNKLNEHVGKRWSKSQRRMKKKLSEKNEKSGSSKKKGNKKKMRKKFKDVDDEL